MPSTKNTVTLFLDDGRDIKVEVSDEIRDIMWSMCDDDSEESLTRKGEIVDKHLRQLLSAKIGQSALYPDQVDFDSEIDSKVDE